MKQYDYKTVSRTMLGDLHTPVSTYLKVRDIFPQSALMESSDYHGSENNRSFIALCPLASVSIDHGTAIFRLPDDSREEHPITEEYRVENALNDFLGRFHVEGEYSNYCGLYGYTSFNAVRYFENIPVKDSREATNDAPDMLYILYKYLIVFNDFKNEMLLLEMLAPGETSELDLVQKAIHNRNYTAYDFRAIGPTTSPLTDKEHKANIRRGIAHCLRGDVFQIVLSRRFEQRFTGDDFKLYRALRSINPSPYLFYFDFGGFRIFGSSPETHCRIEGRHAYIDPIAGTTKRTGDAEQDALNAEITELENAVTGYEQSRKSAEKFIALIDKYENFDTLTNTMLNEFVEKILVHERARKGSQDTTQEVEIYFNFVGRYIPPALQPVPLTPEEQEELRKKEERKDRLHQNYLRRKANGKQKEWEERYNAKRKAKMEAAKAAIRAEDMEKGIFIPVSQLPKQEPHKATVSASAAI